MKQLLLLCALCFAFTSFGQNVPGGHPTPGPRLDDSLMLKFEKKENRILKAFSDSWESCGKGSVPFKTLKQLNNSLLVDRVESTSQNSKATCSPDCLFTKEAKKALKSFIHSSFVVDYLIKAHDYSEDEARSLLASLKTYE